MRRGTAAARRSSLVAALLALAALSPALAQGREATPKTGPRLPEASFQDGVLHVQSLGLTLPLGPGWVLRLPLVPGFFSFDHELLQAHIVLTTAPWDKDERPGALRAVVQAGLTAAQNRLENHGPVSHAGLRGEEAYGRFSSAGRGPREDSRIHLVGMHTDDLMFLISLRAPEASFELADAGFVTALRGLKIEPSRPPAPPAGKGREEGP